MSPVAKINSATWSRMGNAPIISWTFHRLSPEMRYWRIRTSSRSRSIDVCNGSKLIPELTPEEYSVIHCLAIIANIADAIVNAREANHIRFTRFATPEGSKRGSSATARDDVFVPMFCTICARRIAVVRGKSSLNNLLDSTRKAVRIPANNAAYAQITSESV